MGTVVSISARLCSEGRAQRRGVPDQGRSDGCMTSVWLNGHFLMLDEQLTGQHQTRLKSVWLSEWIPSLIVAWSGTGDVWPDYGSYLTGLGTGDAWLGYWDLLLPGQWRVILGNFLWSYCVIFEVRRYKFGEKAYASWMFLRIFLNALLSIRKDFLHVNMGTGTRFSYAA